MKKKKITLASESLWLLTVIYPRANSKTIENCLASAGINANFLFYAHGTATEELIRLLGLAETPMEVCYAFLSPSMKARLFGTLKPALSARGQGIAFTTPVSALVGKSYYPFLSGQEI